MCVCKIGDLTIRVTCVGLESRTIKFYRSTETLYRDMATLCIHTLYQAGGGTSGAQSDHFGQFSFCPKPSIALPGSRGYL